MISLVVLGLCLGIPV
ncbi:hypothetical protein [Brevundimonas diminuta]